MFANIRLTTTLDQLSHCYDWVTHLEAPAVTFPVVCCEVDPSAETLNNIGSGVTVC